VSAAYRAERSECGLPGRAKRARPTVPSEASTASFKRKGSRAIPALSGGLRMPAPSSARAIPPGIVRSGQCLGPVRPGPRPVSRSGTECSAHQSCGVAGTTTCVRPVGRRMSTRLAARPFFAPTAIDIGSTCDLSGRRRGRQARLLSAGRHSRYRPLLPLSIIRTRAERHEARPKHRGVRTRRAVSAIMLSGGMMRAPLLLFAALGAADGWAGRRSAGRAWRRLRPASGGQPRGRS
jgi:hypothetical protein